MSTEIWIGLILTLVAGLQSGNCMLPMKFARRWKWENTWLLFSILSLVVFPWALALVLVRDVLGVYESLPAGVFALPLVLGAAWGVAQVLFGLSVARLGMALGYAIIVGLGALLGTLIPLVVKNPGVLASGRGAIILTGMVTMVAGIIVCASAGRRREQAQQAVRLVGSGGYAAAVATAVLCGLLAPMINYSFAFGQEIAAQAAVMGTSPARAAYAVWPVALAGGFVPNLAYSIYLLSRNGSWGRFAAPGVSDPLGASGMAVLWMGSIAVYGVASVYLGALGTSIGWALFQIFMIMTANLSGVLTGEWKSAPRRATRHLWIGLTLLAIATAVISAGNA